ncbi:hypothetical protein BS78_03G331600 [Paspalum vaginatum]|nr:hypothetical protein BS78_03G331600 [Paspalum vaginatum]
MHAGGRGATRPSRLLDSLTEPSLFCTPLSLSFSPLSFWSGGTRAGERSASSGRRPATALQLLLLRRSPGADLFHR